MADAVKKESRPAQSSGPQVLQRDVPFAAQQIDWGKWTRPLSEYTSTSKPYGALMATVSNSAAPSNYYNAAQATSGLNLQAHGRLG